jgi:hypothetical protein
VVEAPGVAPNRQRFQDPARRRAFLVKLLMASTFDVFIDSSRFFSVTLESTQSVEAFWRRRETRSRRLHRPRARQGQTLHHPKRMTRPIGGSADGAAQASGACCCKAVEVQILSSAPTSYGDFRSFIPPLLRRFVVKSDRFVARTFALAAYSFSSPPRARSASSLVGNGPAASPQRPSLMRVPLSTIGSTFKDFNDPRVFPLNHSVLSHGLLLRPRTA